jgi:hypothetical protein
LDERAANEAIERLLRRFFFDQVSTRIKNGDLQFVLEIACQNRLAIHDGNDAIDGDFLAAGGDTLALLSVSRRKPGEKRGDAEPSPIAESDWQTIYAGTAHQKVCPKLKKKLKCCA